MSIEEKTRLAVEPAEAKDEAAAPAEASPGRQRWRALRDEAVARRPFWKSDFTTVSGLEVPHLTRPEDIAGHRRRERHRQPRGVPLHPRRPRHRLPRPAVDHAPVRRLRHRRARPTSASSTCSSTARPACRSPSTCPRLYGLRLGRPAVARRGRQVRRRDRQRCADMEILFDGIPLDRGLHLDDHQLARPPILLAMYLAVAEKQGVDVATSCGGTLQNDILKEYIAQKECIFPPRPSHAADHRHDRVLRRARCRAGTRSRSPATTSARRARRRSRSWPSPCADGIELRRRRHRAPASTSTTSRRGCRSSSTPTTTSSRRSPSSARPAASGRR